MGWTHGAFYWNELQSWNVERAKTFYADTLGWHYEKFPMPDGAYWIIKSGDSEEALGGIFQLNETHCAGAPEAWMSYVAVDDIDARLAKAEAAGATVLRAPFDVPQVGRIAILKEPGGALVGWITPAQP